MIPDILYYVLMLGYFLYIIFRFSKPPDDNKKKEPDVHNIEKIYMISSICFVIWTFFVLNPTLTLLVPFHSYFKHILVLFGIFNAFMTVLYIRYRDDIYFYESYNLCFTLVITFIAIYFIWNPIQDELFRSGIEDLPSRSIHEDLTTYNENGNVKQFGTNKQGLFYTREDSDPVTIHNAAKNPLHPRDSIRGHRLSEMSDTNERELQQKLDSLKNLKNSQFDTEQI